MPTLRDVRLFAKYHLLRRAHDHPYRDTEMGVVPLGYEPAAFERDVRAFSDRYDVGVEATVRYGSAERPILSVRSRTPDAKRRVLVLSGVHGNEQAGILCVPEILERFHVRPPKGVALHVLTPVNPTGAAELSRFNGEGFDVNRDFVRFETAEARAAKHAIDARPDFVVSLHEGPQDAAFMFANRHVAPDLADRLLRRLEAGGTVLAERDYFGARLVPRGLSPSTPAQRAILRVWSGTLGMMAANEYAARAGIPELTLESSWRSPDRAARLRAHVDLVLGVAEELAT